MVKKLLKYEFISYLRTLMPMYGIMLAIGLVTRFVQLFENEHYSYDVVFGSSVIALAISAVVCLVMTVVVGVTRFYKNLYSAEGYLSFTLPVTAGQHIFAKLIMLTAFTFLGLFAILVSASLSMMGEVLWEVFKAIGYLLRKLFEMAGGNLFFYIPEALLLIVVSFVYLYLLYYCCITIGQTAKKNRIFMAFVAYFVYYLITQFFGTAFVIVGMFFGQYGIWEAITDAIVAHPFASVHILLIGATILISALSAAYYFIIRHIMTKKLNLE